jgi:hypothetical protein
MYVTWARHDSGFPARAPVNAGDRNAAASESDVFADEWTGLPGRSDFSYMPEIRDCATAADECINTCLEDILRRRVSGFAGVTPVRYVVQAAPDDLP